ncbi:MAG: trypsin-like peptidase domain-containing protein [Anaerolineales bacterium]|nr:trypsin-like peptidase domain-containing protein [Chloroflexota bacterium]MBL6979987.1 trypsin-like peptidase domain-containing protein [Anaerolineales bacterium]
MKTTSQIHILIVLFLITTACNLRNEQDLVEKIPLDSLVESTVFIGTKRESIGDDVKTKGSGIVISPDGLILTNAHVVSPLEVGKRKLNPELFFILTSVNSAEKPTIKYLADIVAIDATLDLAILQITHHFFETEDGEKTSKEINSDEINLPYIEIDYSHTAGISESIHVLGYPTIGEDTITYSTGIVAGFSEEVVCDLNNNCTTAWIKTDAVISAGNSGGPVVNNEGKLIGIATKSFEVECRRVADTNEDGDINNKDHCVAAGGFLNKVRPIHFANDIISASIENREYGSRYVQPDIPFWIEFIGWSEELETTQCPNSTVDFYDEYTNHITAYFDYSGLEEDEIIQAFWFHDVNLIKEEKVKFIGNQSIKCMPLSLEFEQYENIPPGNYSLLVAQNDQPLAFEHTKVTEFDQRISISGYVRESVSKNAIANALVYILKPGVSPYSWIIEGKDDAVARLSKTDENGLIIFEGIPRGDKFTIVAMAKGYQTGFISILIHEFETFQTSNQIEILLESKK